MKLLITKGKWKWTGWFLEVSEPYAEILQLDHDADDLSEANALAISRVPEMLALLVDIVTMGPASDTELGDVAHELIDRAGTLLEELVEE